MPKPIWVIIQSKRSQRAFETAVAPLGMRPPHFDLRAVLDQHGPVSQKQAAQLLGVDSARVVALAGELADRGALQDLLSSAPAPTAG